MLCDEIIRRLNGLQDITLLSITALNYYSTNEPIVIISVRTKSPHNVRLESDKFTIQKDAPYSTHVQVTLQALGGFTGLIAIHRWARERFSIFEQEIISNAIRYQYTDPINFTD